MSKAAHGVPSANASRTAPSGLALLVRQAIAASAAVSALTTALGVCGCGASRPPILTEERVDLPRFMGDWYVIASIPTRLERGIRDAVESYRLEEDGSIKTTFTFREGGGDGELRSYHPRGFVLDSRSNAVWGMQFVWPIRADYRIVYVNDDYTQTIVGREKRDYVWIMARTPEIPDADYQDLVRLVAAQGYDVEALQRVPHGPRVP